VDGYEVGSKISMSATEEARDSDDEVIFTGSETVTYEVVSDCGDEIVLYYTNTTGFLDAFLLEGKCREKRSWTSQQAIRPEPWLPRVYDKWPHIDGEIWSEDVTMQ